MTQAYKIPTAVQWSLGIQHQLRDNAVLSVTYVGNSNYHQSQGRNINTLAENDPNRLGVCGSTCGYTGAALECQPLPALSGLGNHRPHGNVGANSNYNSLQVSLRVTAWKNLTLNSTYTWSHAFDIIDGEIFSNINNPFNARWDYGPAGFDRRQISVTSFIYNIPFFQNSGSQAMKTALGGWELSGIAPSNPEPRLASAPAPITSGRRRHRQPRERRRAGHLSGNPVPVVQHLVVHKAGTAAVGHRGQERRGRPGTQQLEHGAVQSVPD